MGILLFLDYHWQVDYIYSLPTSSASLRIEWLDQIGTREVLCKHMASVSTTFGLDFHLALVFEKLHWWRKDIGVGAKCSYSPVDRSFLGVSCSVLRGCISDKGCGFRSHWD